MNYDWLNDIDTQHWEWHNYQIAANIKFLTIVAFGSGTLRLGVSSNGEWIVKSDNTIFPLLENEKKFTLLSLLEMNYEEFKKKVYTRIKDLNGNPDLAWRTFPIKKIILAGLLQESDYWARLALSWIPAIAVDAREEFYAPLKALSLAKWASQHVRHQAYRFIKQIERR